MVRIEHHPTFTHGRFGNEQQVLIKETGNSKFDSDEASNRNNTVQRQLAGQSLVQPVDDSCEVNRHRLVLLRDHVCV